MPPLNQIAARTEVAFARQGSSLMTAGRVLDELVLPALGYCHRAVPESTLAQHRKYPQTSRPPVAPHSRTVQVGQLIPLSSSRLIEQLLTSSSEPRQSPWELCRILLEVEAAQCEAVGSAGKAVDWLKWFDMVDAGAVPTDQCTPLRRFRPSLWLHRPQSSAPHKTQERDTDAGSSPLTVAAKCLFPQPVLYQSSPTAIPPAASAVQSTKQNEDVVRRWLLFAWLCAEVILQQWHRVVDSSAPSLSSSFPSYWLKGLKDFESVLSVSDATSVEGRRTRAAHGDGMWAALRGRRNLPWQEQEEVEVQGIGLPPSFAFDAAVGCSALPEASKQKWREFVVSCLEVGSPTSGSDGGKVKGAASVAKAKSVKERRQRPQQQHQKQQKAQQEALIATAQQWRVLKLVLQLLETILCRLHDSVQRLIAVVIGTTSSGPEPLLLSPPLPLPLPLAAAAFTEAPSAVTEVEGSVQQLHRWTWSVRRRLLRYYRVLPNEEASLVPPFELDWLMDCLLDEKRLSAYQRRFSPLNQRGE